MPTSKMKRKFEKLRTMSPITLAAVAMSMRPSPGAAITTLCAPIEPSTYALLSFSSVVIC
ncbi:hypothetical protein MCOR25_010869 [Pyricularia grisea]|nr:hypothetical protein MCOR25_010869 [Pyricularia grisea]